MEHSLLIHGWGIDMIFIKILRIWIVFDSIGLLFLDCKMIPVFASGLGPRYRFISKNISMQIFILSLYVAQNSDTSHYHASICPFSSIVANYHLEKLHLGLRITFSSKNETHNSTTGFNLLLFYVDLCISL